MERKEEDKTKREVVLDLLHAVFTEGVFLHLALQRAFSSYPYFDDSKRALITRLSHGTVERYIQLDDCISRYSNTPLKPFDFPLINFFLWIRFLPMRPLMRV